MINKIIDGISISLHLEFGEEYEIYTDSVEQGLQEPCFSVFSINHSTEGVLGNRYNRINRFCIQYFPSTDEINAECNEILERLYDCLEYIQVDYSPLRGKQMRGEMVDDVLNFFVDYDMYVYKIGSPKDPMEELKINGGVR